MKLIPDVQGAWKLHSVQGAAVLGTLLAVQAAVPEVQSLEPLRPLVESQGFKLFLSLNSLAIILLRLVKQPTLGK